MSQFNNVYRRHTPLVAIAQDGWSCEFSKSQTILGASNAGYANCIAVAVIDRVWNYWDSVMKTQLEWEAANHVSTDPTQF
ncbi:MAG: hypothetical protein J5965_04905 [Aeriscardovia sp.]|nr:hypothetical protein [Aeriscardovia sp.]